MTHCDITQLKLLRLYILILVLELLCDKFKTTYCLHTVVLVKCKIYAWKICDLELFKKVMEVVNSGDWNNLPNVVLDQIFSYLSWSDKIKASSTCKRWRCGLYHPSLWKTLSFSLQSLNGDRVAKAHYFIETCARIVRSAHIIFDSLDCSSLSLTDELLDILRENSQLKKLMLIPSHGVLYPITSPCNSITLNSRYNIRIMWFNV